MEQLEFVAWFMVGLLVAFVVLVSFLYWMEAKRDMEEIDHSVKKCRRMVSEADKVALI